MRKSKKQEAIPTIDLVTKPTDTKLRVKGLEVLASTMRQRACQIEMMQLEQKQDRVKLLEEVDKQRLDSEKSGKFFKSCVVECQDEMPAKVVYMNKFSKVDGEHEPALRNALGKLFDQLYIVEQRVSLREDVNVEYIKYLLGDKFDMLFGVKTQINHSDNFMEKRANLRPSLDNKTNDFIDGLVSQVQCEASLYLKG